MDLHLLLLQMIALGVILYVVHILVYRLYLSPIVKFPGSKLAASSYWFEFYHDVIRRGEYVWEIRKMHEQYGPVIRVSPYELHVSDPAFAPQLYPQVTKNVEKYARSATMFGTTEPAFATVGHDLHRLRRGALNTFFSKQSIRRLEPIIQSIVDTLYQQMKQYQGTGKPINLVHAYGALTQDIIHEYCFAASKNCLLMPDFAPLEYELLEKPVELTHIFKQIPSVVLILRILPDWFVQRFMPLAARQRKHRANVRERVETILADHDNKTAPDSHTTVFHALNSDPSLPSSQKTASRLATEASSLVGAGTLTTARTLKTTTYHILANPPILSRLLVELEAAIPDPTLSTPLTSIETLPYLSAVINEGLRLSYGTVQRLMRVHPDKALRLNDWVIPPGTPVGMTSIFTHDNPSLFPDPYVFNPDRWLGPEAKGRVQLLQNFGKGTRACVGMNLAYAEIYLTLVKVFRGFGSRMRLFETERERDVDVKKDFFAASPSLDSKGVRVLINA
ncbi:hypothetical protein MMC20_006198 [Loxospora ochrophaea]|nr:hypothetical protein [Loxospora ochrophaea]